MMRSLVRMKIDLLKSGSVCADANWRRPGENDTPTVIARINL